MHRVSAVSTPVYIWCILQPSLIDILLNTKPRIESTSRPTAEDRHERTATIVPLWQRNIIEWEWHGRLEAAVRLVLNDTVLFSGCRYWCPTDSSRDAHITPLRCDTIEHPLSGDVVSASVTLLSCDWSTYFLDFHMFTCLVKHSFKSFSSLGEIRSCIGRSNSLIEIYIFILWLHSTVMMSRSQL